MNVQGLAYDQKKKYLPGVLFLFALAELCLCMFILVERMRPPMFVSGDLMNAIAFSIVVPIPALIGLMGRLEIQKMLNKKELSPTAGTRINTVLGLLLAVTYGLVSQTLARMHY